MGWTTCPDAARRAATSWWHSSTSHSWLGAVIVTSQTSGVNPGVSVGIGLDPELHDYRCGDRFTATLRAEAVVRLSLNADAFELAADAGRDVAAHLGGRRGDSRGGAKHGAVQVDDLRSV